MLPSYEINTTSSYNIFIYSDKKDALEFDFPQDSRYQVSKQIMYDGRVTFFNLYSEEPLDGLTFGINVTHKGMCNTTAMPSLDVSFTVSELYLFDATYYISSHTTNPLMYLLPSLSIAYPQYLQHFINASTVMSEHILWTSKFTNWLQDDPINIVKFLHLFNNDQPPSLLAGMLMLAKLDIHVRESDKITKYITIRLLDFIPKFYQTCIFNNTTELGESFVITVQNLVRIIEDHCGAAFAGFLMVSFCAPLEDFSIVDVVLPASDTEKRHIINIATATLFQKMFKMCGTGQSLFVPGLAAAITPGQCIRTKPLAEKLGREWSSLDFRTVDIDTVASIVSARLQTSTMDYSSQGLFEVLKPLLESRDDFPDKFLEHETYMPFRHLANFAVVFQLPLDKVSALAAVALEYERDPSMLFVSSLGQILVIVSGESRLSLFGRFMRAARQNAFSIGEQWREQCTKAVWRGMAEDDEEMVDILTQAMGNDVCSLAAGYFSIDAFVENDKLSSILQQCLVTILPSIQRTPRELGREFVNVLAVMRSEWIVSIDPLSVKRIAEASIRLVSSARKRIDNADDRSKGRIEILDECARRVLETIKSNYPHLR